jgi:aminoglycoside phosphotransferase (APT) family kinase protein
MMFGLKNKKRLNAATTGFSSEPKPSASTRTIQRNSFEKVVTAGKNLCYNLSVTLTRKPCRQTSPINRSTSANRPSSNASTATTSNQNLDNCDAGSLCQKSSSSTLLTESSLLVLDCGETFYVPGISPSRSHLDTGRAPIQEPNGLSVSSMESATSWNNTKSLDQPEEEIPAVPEQLYVKKGMKDRLCRHLKATYKNLILPRLLRFGRNSSRYGSAVDEDAPPAINEPVDQCETVDTDSDDDDDDEEEEEEEGDGSHPRCDFQTIAAISDAKYHELFKACNLFPSADCVAVVRRDKGAYNAATFVDVLDGGKTHKFVVRMPGHGTLEHWTDEDAYVLEREAQLIEYIRKNTAAPVAQVIDYATGHENALGFPHIVMTMLPGKPAYTLWFPEGYPFVGDDDVFRDADVPPPYIKKRRVAFLRSLAKVMTRIQSLEFDGIGVPAFDNDGRLTGTGPTCHFKGASDVSFKRQPAATTQEYLQARMKSKVKHLDEQHELGDLDGLLENLGIRTILNLVFAQPAFHGPAGETFTIHHNDLDLQNILVDEEGNVTGIIDWDNAMSAPRCVGASAVPRFLRNDWFPEWESRLEVSPYMAWNYHHYREIYAAALVEAGNIEDAKYTTKSALYQAAIATCTEGVSDYDFIPKLLHEIPHCRVDASDFLKGLGMGAWHSAIRMLETHFAKIFEPELPSEGLLEALDVELEMQTTWWSCCDELLNLYEDEKTDDVSRSSHINY